MTQPRLLFVVTEDWYFVSHRLPLAAAAVRAGYDVHVATRVGRHAEVIAGTGATVVPLAWERRVGAPWREAAAIDELRRHCVRLRPDIVHCVALKPVVYGGIAARLAGVPAVVNAVAGLGYAFTSTRPAARLARMVMVPALRSVLRGRGRWTIVQNGDDREVLVRVAGVDPSRLVLIRGAGVDLADFAHAPLPAETPPIVMLATRMLWEKGVGEFVEAAGRLRQAGVSARFVLVGDSDTGNPNAVDRATLERWHAEGAVEWWGRRDDMPDVLRAASIVCLPSSYGEGIPKVLIEAAAIGRPLIATDAPGCREVVRPGVNGALVPLRDGAALAEAIGGMLAAPAAERARMGCASRRLAEEEFSLDRVLTQTLALYRTVSS